MISSSVGPKVGWLGFSVSVFVFMVVLTLVVPIFYSAIRYGSLPIYDKTLPFFGGWCGLDGLNGLDGMVLRCGLGNKG